MDYKNRVVNFFGMKLKITYVDKCEDEEGRWIFGIKMGGSMPRIMISTKDEEGNDLDKEIVELTLRHELFHAILDRFYFEESYNETLVEWLATATKELHKQGFNI